MHTNLIYSQGESTESVRRVLQALPLDAAANHGYPYRVVDSTHPAICMYHVLAAWLQGQVVVLVGNADTAADFLEPGSYVVVKDAPFDSMLESEAGTVSYAHMRFPSPSRAPTAVVISPGATGKPKGLLLTRQGVDTS